MREYFLLLVWIIFVFLLYDIGGFVLEVLDILKYDLDNMKKVYTKVFKVLCLSIFIFFCYKVEMIVIFLFVYKVFMLINGCFFWIIFSLLGKFGDN